MREEPFFYFLTNPFDKSILLFSDSLIFRFFQRDRRLCILCEIEKDHIITRWSPRKRATRKKDANETGDRIAWRITIHHATISIHSTR